MNFREKFSVVIVCMGLILAILPLSGNKSFIVGPKTLLTQVLDKQSYFTVDQVARFIVSEDSSIQIIDVRSPKEFKTMNIPGSINVPYSELLNSDPGTYLKEGANINILYSNGDIYSNSALAITKGLNYKNTFVMKGGLNEWFNIIMNSSFRGDRISAKENALYETRTRARSMFVEMNSLPDSLKLKFFEAKHLERKKLDGGCE